MIKNSNGRFTHKLACFTRIQSCLEMQRVKLMVDFLAWLDHATEQELRDYADGTTPHPPWEKP